MKPNATLNAQPQPRYVRAAALRRRFDNMPQSTFYYRLKRGLLPEPVYPFGSGTPYWELAVIEAFEAAAMTRDDVLESEQHAARYARLADAREKKAAAKRDRTQAQQAA